MQRYKYRKTIDQRHEPLLNVLIGAGTTSYDGWLSTDYPFFDITNPKHWNYLFKKNKPDYLLAEHVFEHLTVEQAKMALTCAFSALNEKGNFRIAVPDKNHPDPDYIEHVRPGGSGPGCDDHKSFWEYKSFCEMASAIGYHCNTLEYFDEKGQLHSSELDENLGKINRSIHSYKGSIKGYSSLIVDLVKPSS